ncbi:hypothetical protein [Thermopirellula anaerolimosa]
MSALHLLNRPGVRVVWENGKLRLGVEPETLTADELALLREHKAEVGGWLLLHKLWEAGFRLRLEPSRSGPGYVLIPLGQPAQPVDFPALFDLYDTFHDAAVCLLLDVCKKLNIAPEDWPAGADRLIVAEAQHEDGRGGETAPRPKAPERRRAV